MNFSDSFKGKKIWVTGGAGYLETPITRALDALGAEVVCFDLPGRAEAMVENHQLGHTKPVSLDVNDTATLPANVEKLVAQHGVPDAVAHLAFASSAGHTLESLPAEEFQKTFDRAFLLSDGASYVTGQSLVVDGGWTTW